MKRKKYNAKDLADQCDPNAPMPADLEEWENMKPIGSEFGADERRSLGGVLKKFSEFGDDFLQDGREEQEQADRAKKRETKR